MIQVKRILYPTDFSRCAKQALNHALFLARELDAELYMLHAVVLHQDDPADPKAHFPDDGELVRRLFEIADAKMAHLVPPAVGESVTVVKKKRPGFSPAEIILDYARDVDADLIVMGTHGRRGPAQFFLGSVAQEIVRYAECPVLTFREREESRELEAVREVLVPVDFSEHSQAAIRAGKEIAASLGARTQLVHVVATHRLPAIYDPGLVLDVTERIKERCVAELGRLLDESGGPDVEAELKVLSGQAHHRIVESARQLASPVIVIPSHGLTGIQRVLLGSTAERVVRSAGCPVLTLKPHGKSLVVEEEPVGEQKAS